MNWRDGFKSSKFKIEFTATLILLILILIALANFLNFVETRDGVVLNDPLLNLFEPVDLPWLTFGLIYISLVTFLTVFLKNPELLLTAFQSYIVMTVFRITVIYLLPLNPPAKMIPLGDPFVEFFGTGQLLTKDLFFSGHTATLFLLFLLADSKSLKIFFLISTILVTAAVLLQHVHYSIDVLAAPFFSYCSFILTKRLRKKFSVTVT
ncbi:MAG: phosphatase PAP2-related protein [Ignavibacteria bacterium]|nr:phosphatase PAP2-related protein [Ignavibacteria bacterium]